MIKIIKPRAHVLYTSPFLSLAFVRQTPRVERKCYRKTIKLTDHKWTLGLEWGGEMNPIACLLDWGFIPLKSLLSLPLLTHIASFSLPAPLLKLITPFSISALTCRPNVGVETVRALRKLMRGNQVAEHNLIALSLSHIDIHAMFCWVYECVQLAYFSLN